MPDAASTFGPIPYFPGLKKIVPNVTCALLVTYLEMRFPAPQDDRRHISSLPVTVPLDTVREDLQISRRTLGLNLYALARVYREESKRWSSARASREFIQQHHRTKGTRKLYSIVCDHNLERARTFILRRNMPMLLAAFANAGVSIPLALSPAQSETRDSLQLGETSSELTKLADAPLLISQPQTFAEMILRASELSGDRRRTRYVRLRKAMESGLEDPGALSAKQPKGKKRNNQVTRSNEAVDPQLPDEVMARLIKLRER